MWRCAQCNAENPEAASCAKCGAPRPGPGHSVEPVRAEGNGVKAVLGLALFLIGCYALMTTWASGMYTAGPTGRISNGDWIVALACVLGGVFLLGWAFVSWARS